MDEHYLVNNPSESIAVRLAFSVLLLLDDLATLVGAALLADAVSAHQAIAVRAGDKCWHRDSLMLAAIAASMSRNLIFWQSSHEYLFAP